MNQYAEIIKKLFDVTKIKFAILANELGYNSSYISKWQSGSKLPSKKNIHSINERTARLFANELIRQGRISDFFVELDLPIPDNPIQLSKIEYLKNIIMDLLTEAYEDAVDHSSHKNELSSVQVAIGSNEVRTLFQEILRKEHLTHKHKFSEILISLPICSSSTQYIFDVFDSNQYIKVRIGMSPNDLSHNPIKSLTYIYKLFLLHPKMTIEIYDNKELKNLNLIVAKDVFAMNYATDKENVLQLLTYFKGTDDVYRAYKLLNRRFHLDDIILKEIPPQTLHRNRYRAEFYSGDNFNILTTYGFEFLLPPHVIEKIATFAYNENHSIDEMLAIKRLQIAWEENFEDKNISFIIVKSSLMKYLEDGKLIYMDTHYRLSIEDRIEHVSYAINRMRNNPNIEIYILDDSQINREFDNFNIGIFCNDKKLFLKNYTKAFDDVNNFISVAVNEIFISSANEALNFVKTLPFCQRFTPDDLEAKWEKYKKMFIRIMQINENIESTTY